MRRSPIPKVERGRVTKGPMGSRKSYGMNGAFVVRGPHKRLLKIVASDGALWEHVSVSPAEEARTPTWEEMCWVKDAFWKAEECVVQYHPPRDEYVNCHPYTLHLWKPSESEIPRPPSILVGAR